MKKLFFVIAMLVSFIAAPISILKLWLFTAVFLSAGGGKFLAVATGHTQVGNILLVEFTVASIGLILVSFVYTKFIMYHLGKLAQWMDRQNF